LTRIVAQVIKEKRVHYLSTVFIFCPIGISPQIEIDGFMFKTRNFLSSVLHDKMPCQRSVLLWLMYLKFLSRMGFKKELESAAYQALRESPFSKVC
jgi:hypothetical protein